MTEPARELLGQLLADEPPISAAGLARTAIRDGRTRRRRRRGAQAACGVALAGLLFAGVQHLLVTAPTAVTVPAVVAATPDARPSSTAQAPDAKEVLRNLLEARQVQVTGQQGFAVGQTRDGIRLLRGGFNTAAGGSVSVNISYAGATCEETDCRTLPDGRSYQVLREQLPHAPGFEVVTVMVFDTDRVVGMSMRNYLLSEDGKQVLGAGPSRLPLTEPELLNMAADQLWSRMSWQARG